MTIPVSIRPINVALLDLYNGESNLGIQAIQDLVTAFGSGRDNAVKLRRYDVRQHGDVPGLDHDVYLASGGPGSPFEGEGSAWEAAYFNWMDEVFRHNDSNAVKQGNTSPKHVLFICHSFQMMCRHFQLGSVVRRQSQSFGVFRTHQTAAGLQDPLFAGLHNPFYAADFRDWQVIQPDHENLQALDARVIAIEKKRAHVPLERALMGIRLSKEIVGVQFHPEADPAGMLVHFQQEARQKAIIAEHGEAKYHQILERLRDPEFLLHTYQRIIPNFLRQATSVYL